MKRPFKPNTIKNTTKRKFKDSKTDSYLAKHHTLPDNTFNLEANFKLPNFVPNSFSQER